MKNSDLDTSILKVYFLLPKCMLLSDLLTMQKSAETFIKITQKQISVEKNTNFVVKQ